MSIVAPTQAQSEAFNVDFTFSETVTGFTLSDITATNATVSGFSGSGASYSATLTPNGEGDISITVAANAAFDEAGNGNIESSISVELSAAPIFLISQSPSDGEIDVSVTTNINFTFNAQVIPMPGKSITINKDGTTVYSHSVATFSEGENFLIEIPENVIEFNSTYTVRIDPGSFGSSNGALSELIIWSFTTESNTLFAADDEISTLEDTSITFNPLLNDQSGNSEVDYSTLEIVTFGDGNIVIDRSNGDFIYEPNLNYNGLDEFTYRFKNNDGDESNIARITVNVIPVNDAPVIVSSPNLETLVGELYTYNLLVEDDGEYSVSVSSLPSWLTFDGVSVLSGVPSLSDVGETTEIEILVDDGEFVVSEQFAITVNELPAPEIQINYSWNSNPIIIDEAAVLDVNVTNSSDIEFLIESISLVLEGTNIQAVSSDCAIDDEVTCFSSYTLSAGETINFSVESLTSQSGVAIVNSIVTLVDGRNVSESDQVFIAEQVSSDSGVQVAVEGVTVFSYGDLDNDGFVDLVLSSSSGIQLFKNDSLGNFVPSVILSELSDIVNLLVNDVNNDGLQDIIYAGQTLSGVFINNGNDTFIDRTLSTIASREAAVVDMDLDGALDIVFLDESAKGYTIFYQPLDGVLPSFNMSVINSSKSANVSEIDDQATAVQSLLSVGLFDINFDGNLDLLLGRNDEATIAVFAGSLTEQEIPLNSVKSFVSADINRDNMNELYLNSELGLFVYNLATGVESVIDNLSIKSVVVYGDSLALLADSGEIAFVDYINNSYTIGLVVESDVLDKVAFLDLDNDGDLDLVSLNPSTGTIELKFKQTTSDFGEQVSDLELRLAGGSTKVYVDEEYTLLLELENLQGVASDITITSSNAENLSSITINGEKCNLEGASICLISRLAHNELLNIEFIYNGDLAGSFSHEITVETTGNEATLDNNSITGVVEVIERPVVIEPKPKKSSGSFNYNCLYLLLMLITYRVFMYRIGLIVRK